MIKGLKTQGRGSNTGKPAQAFDPSLLKGAILVPFAWNVPIAPGDTDTIIINRILASLFGVGSAPGTAIAVDYAQRSFYIGPFEQFDDKSDAPTIQTLGYGKKIDTFRGVYNLDFIFDQGGVDYFHSVLSFRGKKDVYKLVLFGANGELWCTKQFDNNGNIIGMQGVQMSRLYPNDFKFGNEKSEALYGVSFSLSNSKEINENAFVVLTNMDLVSYIEGYGIQDVYLNVPLTLGVPTPIVHAAGTLAVTPLFAGGGLNLETVLPALATPSAWAATNNVTGAAITITSVTATPGVFTFLFDVTTLGTMFTAGQSVVLKLLNVPALGVLGYQWYESNAVTVSLS
jgi:hypothetical protein